jgi:hypothetical protein
VVGAAEFVAAYRCNRLQFSPAFHLQLKLQQQTLGRGRWSALIGRKRKKDDMHR